jgi:cell division inhibitor SepF
MSMFRRAMEYLGLGADEMYDDGDQSTRSRRPTRGADRDDDYDDEYDDDMEEADDAPPARRPGARRDDSGVTVRGAAGASPAKTVKPLDSATVEPITLKPTSYEHCREIADRFKGGQPVILNLIATDKVERRRIIDFAAGMVYGLNGSIDLVTSKVFRLTPNGVRLPRE